MTDRTPPQERERLVSVMYDAFYEYGDAREALDDKAATEAGNRHDAAQRALIAFDAAAVAARVRAELREKVEGMRDAYRHATDCTRPEVACHCSAGDVHDFANDVLAALAEETTG